MHCVRCFAVDKDRAYPDIAVNSEQKSDLKQNTNSEERTYICIDLKSFYASVEAVERGMDPMTENLVVADPSRGRGAICLAITPAMKKLGVRNRCRLFEIPKGINYVTALPHMKKYMRYSAKIYVVYLRFVSADDIHVYSIDECFIDATDYLKIYGVDGRDFAKSLKNAVFAETGITATCGIGTNLFLAKVALDIDAKHAADGIGYLDRVQYRRKIWRHRPITDVWNVGRGIAKRLEKYGIYDMRGVAVCDEELLYKEFGVNAEFLIDHSHGEEPCTIADIHKYKSKSRSISNGQVLFSDYSYEQAYTVVKEMADFITQELAEKHLVTDDIFLMIGYSKDTNKPTGGMKKLSGGYTRSYNVLKDAFLSIYESTTVKSLPIRRITVGANRLLSDDFAEYDLFTDKAKIDKECDALDAVMQVKQKYGKNAVFRAIDLKPEATTRVRNKLIGGHNGGEEDE